MNSERHAATEPEGATKRESASAPDHDDSDAPSADVAREAQTSPGDNRSSRAGDPNLKDASDSDEYQQEIVALSGARTREMGLSAPSTAWQRVPEDDEHKVLSHYRRLEELSWESDAYAWPMRNLAWVLRAKREEARMRSMQEARLGNRTTSGGRSLAYFASVITVIGWLVVLCLAFQGPEKVDWRPVVATSGAVLLLLTAATLLFRVARDFHRRSRRYSEDADYTRRLEAAVRLALVSGRRGEQEEVSKALAALAVQFATAPAATMDEPDQHLSAVPDFLTELATALATAAKAAKGGKE